MIGKNAAANAFNNRCGDEVTINTYRYNLISNGNQVPGERLRRL